MKIEIDDKLLEKYKKAFLDAGYVLPDTDKEWEDMRLNFCYILQVEIEYILQWMFDCLDGE